MKVDDRSAKTTNVVLRCVALTIVLISGRGRNLLTVTERTARFAKMVPEIGQHSEHAMISVTVLTARTSQIVTGSNTE